MAAISTTTMDTRPDHSKAAAAAADVSDSGKVHVVVIPFSLSKVIKENGLLPDRPIKFIAGNGDIVEIDGGHAMCSRLFSETFDRDPTITEIDVKRVRNAMPLVFFKNQVELIKAEEWSPKSMSNKIRSGRMDDNLYYMREKKGEDVLIDAYVDKYGKAGLTELTEAMSYIDAPCAVTICLIKVASMLRECESLPELKRFTDAKDSYMPSMTSMAKKKRDLLISSGISVATVVGMSDLELALAPEPATVGTRVAPTGDERKEEKKA
jgi:hypothetical protein